LLRRIQKCTGERRRDAASQPVYPVMQISSNKPALASEASKITSSRGRAGECFHSSAGIFFGGRFERPGGRAAACGGPFRGFRAVPV